MKLVLGEHEVKAAIAKYVKEHYLSQHEMFEIEVLDTMDTDGVSLECDVTVEVGVNKVTPQQVAPCAPAPRTY